MAIVFIPAKNKSQDIIMENQAEVELLATQVHSYELLTTLGVITTHSRVTQETEFHVLL